MSEIRPTRVAKWDNLKAFLILCVVMGHLSEWYVDSHATAGNLFLLIYAFHMPAFLFVSGLFSKKTIREKRYDVIFSYFVLYIVIKVVLFVARYALYGRDEFSLFTEQGLPWYALVLFLSCLITLLTDKLDRRYVMIGSIVLACFAGYADDLGDFLALSRLIAYYPFFFAGYALDADEIAEKSKRKTWIALAAVFVAAYVLFMLRFGDRVYWLRPLLTGRNPFSSLSHLSRLGGLLRLIYYPAVFCLIAAFVILAPARRIPAVSGIGQRSMAVYAFHFCVLYFLWDILELRAWIGSHQGPVFYLILLAASILTICLCSVPALDKGLRRLIRPDFRKLVGNTSLRSLKPQPMDKKQFLLLLVVTLFLTFTFCLYGPLKLYLTNAEDFWLRLGDIVRVAVPTFIVAEAVLLVVGLLLRERGRSFYIKLLFGIALGLYIQGTYINIDYGVLDGGAVRWSDYTVYSIGNTFLWLACLALPFVLDHFVRKYADKAILAIAAFLLVIQLPALAVDLINYQPSEGGELLVSTEGEYELAEGENIIILAFDTMDEAYYADYMEAHPDYAENLDGFIHYDNTLSGAARTIVAIPAILTGKPFLRDMTYSQYLEAVWDGDTPLAALHEAGYDVRVYSDSGYYGTGALDYVANFEQGNEEVSSYFTLCKKLYKFTGYRYFPHRLKRAFWLESSEFDEAKATDALYVEDDAAFHRGFIENGGYTVADGYDNAFRFYMLNGAHPSYKLSADGLDNSQKTSLDEQVEGCFAILKTFLDDLKAKGLYDTSTILVTADHGDKHLAEHLMLLFKPAGADGPLTTSDAPVSMFDLYTLLYQKAGADAPENPYSMDFIALAEDEERERHFFNNSTNNASRVSMNEYVTTGYAGDYDELTLLEQHLGEGADTPYVLGTELTFEMDATANKYCVDGFGHTTGARTLLLGPYAKMEIPIDGLPESGTLAVDFTLFPTLYNATGVKISANGVPVYDKYIETKDLEDGIHFTMDVAEVFPENNVLTLEIELDAVSEEEMELPVNSRTRTISVVNMVIAAE